LVFQGYRHAVEGTNGGTVLGEVGVKGFGAGNGCIEEDFVEAVRLLY
jgi:hypothetical protein